MQDISISFRPQRRFITSKADAHLDQYGFLDKDYIKKTISFYDALNLKHVLILSSPWTGKTFTAKQIFTYVDKCIKRQVADDAIHYKYVDKILFESFFVSIKPTWWDEWINSKDLACLIVDAVDEDFRSQKNRSSEIIDILNSISKSTRDRLSLLIFSRENETPQDFVDELENTFSSDDDRSSSLNILRLAPPDKVVAKMIVGGEDTLFRNVCNLIKKNSLKHIASLPIVLETLKTIDTRSPISLEELWILVLKNILKERRSSITSTSHIDDCFKAVTTIAAVLTFSGKQEVNLGNIINQNPSIDDIFSNTRQDSEKLRQAARYALNSSVFQRTPNGCRFAQYHVQEWFTAFSIKGYHLTRLKPFLTDDNGNPLDQYRGLIGILYQICDADSEVRNWIFNIYKGVPPRSDAAPWSVQDSIKALDELLLLAKNTAYGLPELTRQSLKNMEVEGFGVELSARLQSDKYGELEKDLIIDIAIACSVSEVLPIAVKYVCDSSVAPRLRISCVPLINDHNIEMYSETIQHYIINNNQNAELERRIKSSLIYILYHKGMWNYERTMEYLPEPGDENVVDSQSLLEHVLEQDMTITRALCILRNINWSEIETTSKKSSQRGTGYFRFRGKERLFRKALELIVQSKDLSAKDYATLKAPALIQPRIDWMSDTPDLFLKIKENAETRREMMAIILENPQAPDFRWRFASLLNKDDLEWLYNLCLKRKIVDKSILTEMLWMSEQEDIAAELHAKIRGYIRKTDKKFLNEADENRRRHKAEEKKYQLEKEKRRSQEIKEKVNIVDAVSYTLNNSNYSLKRKYHELTMICLADKEFKPSNISGDISDLSPEQYDEVFDICVNAINTCEPTQVPEGRTFSTAIMYEAIGFISTVRLNKYSIINKLIVEKWLPCVLYLYNMLGIQKYSSDILKICLVADRETSELLVINEIIRELRLDEKSILIAASLPHEIWLESFLEKVINVLSDNSLRLTGRAELLLLSSEFYPEEVKNIALEWLHSDKLTERSKYIYGLDALLLISPNEAWAILNEDVNSDDTDLFKQLRSLRDVNQLMIKSKWTADLLGNLTLKLHTLYPISSDPGIPIGVFRYDDDHRFRELRDRIPRILFERNDAESHKVLRELSAQNARISEWYNYNLAHKDATGILSNISSISISDDDNQIWVPVRQVIKAVEDETCYRLIRSNSDLSRVVIEELERIKKDVKNHLSMLYATKKTKAAKRKRLYEDALQSYICCRLNDRMPGRVLESDTNIYFPNREALTTKNQRNDIKIEAKAINGKPVALIIEIKWSDNKEVSSSLVLQLGKEYLLGGNISYGIYLVGWYSERKWDQKKNIWSQQPEPEDSIAEWLESLKEQARHYNNLHENIHIEPIILDLLWD